VIGVHAADFGAGLGFHEIGDGDGRQDGDDRHHDQQFNEGKAAHRTREKRSDFGWSKRKSTSPTD
jgi:hypothetical protein